MDKLYVIKIGGNIVDDATQLDFFLRSFASVQAPKLLVHGGGKLATRLAETLHIPQQMIEGRRVTDAETLRIITMVYAGQINKNIVAHLQHFACNAIGICGADANVVLAAKRPVTAEGIDYGFVGDVQQVNAGFLYTLLQAQIIPVIAPITHNGLGTLLNTNADTMAQTIATAMSSYYDVQLVYSFEKKGVLSNAEDEQSVIPEITPSSFTSLKTNKVIFGGMIPKLENAFDALHQGVKKVIIGDAAELNELLQGTTGTHIIHD